ncbi:MAG: GH1 family beta-glucosidase [Phycisphaeraceae bacterium]
MAFPNDFVWGAAAAAFQIEGTTRDVPRGESVWDMFCATPGKVYQGHDGKRACLHVEHWREDVALMKALGLGAYRLSIAWPRVIPEGAGEVNEPGLAFYDELVDELLAAGIEPYVTLFHWDLPLKLHKRGGWMNPEIVRWFADYARVVVDRLSDRVTHWITLNEPQCFVLLGHETGEHAPGLKLPTSDILQIGHNALMAHGRAVRVIREHARRSPRVGFAPVGIVSIPETERAVDIEAARRATFEGATESLFNSTWWLDPVFFGRYPEAAVSARLDSMPAVRPEDMKLISEPIDFCAFNLYQAGRVRAGADGGVESVAYPEGHPVTAMEWPVTPDGLYWACRFFHERYDSPLLITENGLSCHDWVSVDGEVHDPNRIDFLTRYLSFVRRACDEGIPVEGYFQWSIMDNFEWAEGYKDRFGLIYVDYASQTRIPKDSYHWYRKTIAENGASLPDCQRCGVSSWRLGTDVVVNGRSIASRRSTEGGQPTDAAKGSGGSTG